MADDLDLDAILTHFGIPDVPPTEELDTIARLVAEVRRLRAIEDAARAFVEYGNEAVAADHQRLVNALEADRG